jgi:acyl dehydratase
MHHEPLGAGSAWAFEDAWPGVSIVHPRGRTIGSDEQASLAMLTDNASDVHLDATYGAATGFGRPLVLGALTVAIVVGMSEPVEWPAGEAARGRRIDWRSIRLVGPVAGGDTITTVSIVLATTPSPDGRGGLVRRRIVGRNQRAEPVVSIEEEREVPRRASANKGLLTTVSPTE